MITATAKRSELFTPFRYPGGKSALFRFLREMIQIRGAARTTYVEPYAGGAGAALSLLITESVERIVINDYDPAMYAAWHAMVNEPRHFTTLIEKCEVSVAEWRRQREIYLEGDSRDSFRLGFSAFYLNRTSRSGVLTAGPIGGYEQRGNYKIDVRFMRAKLVERLEQISLFRNRIEVSNYDGAELIRLLADDPAMFFYIDPPYVVKGSRLYLNAFTDDDHRVLADLLNHSANLSWVLTYDVVDRVRELYRDRRIQELQLNYSMQSKSTATELLIVSDSLQLPATR